MRILILTNLYPPEAVGGYELTCRDVAARWAERGHDIVVLTGRGPDASLPLTWGGLGAPPPLWRRPVVRRQALDVLRRAVARHQPEVVSVWNMTGLPSPLLGGVGGRPQVRVFADAWPALAVSGDPWLAPAVHHPRVAALLRMPAALADEGILCFCSAHLRDRVLAATGWSTERSVVTPLGVDQRDFPPERREPALWSWRLLYVGRLDPGKGVDTLIRALPQLPGQAALRVVGPPEPVHMARVGALVASLSLGDRVVVESLPRDRLASAYRAADVCVFPSEWDEPFGIVPLEAMACGTPVVATGAGGSGEYLSDGDNCVLYPAGDPSALAAAVRRVAGDDGLRSTVVDGGSRTAGALTVDRLADQLEQLHRDAVTAAASGTSPTPLP